MRISSTRSTLCSNGISKSHSNTNTTLKHKHRYNSSQLGAIFAAASTGAKFESKTQFTLIQGPPGTGKTHTIVGLLNATHVADYNSYYAFLEKSIFDGLKARATNIFVNAKNGVKFVNQLVSRMEGEFMKTHLMAVSKRPRILVVAPSNAAVNVIARRIMKDGFMDGNCGRYKPRLVRLGSKINDSELMSVSLTAQCDEYATLPYEEKTRRYRECT